MASETPGGNRPKRRVAALDTRSTDKIYRSGEVSAIRPVAADSTVRPGQKPVPRKPARRVDPKSTDKYYADLDAPAPVQRPAPVRSNPVRRAAARAAAKPETEPEPVGGDTVRTAVEIRPVLDEAIARVRAGKAGIVYVDRTLMMRATSVLDSMATRSEITNEERYAVRLVPMLAGATAAPDTAAPPVPAKSKEAVTDDDIGDPLEFLKNGAEDAPVDTSAVPTTEVKEFESKENGDFKEVADDEEDNDFLRAQGQA